MPEKLSPLTPQQEEALSMIATHGIVDPVQGLRAMGLAPGHGEFEDLGAPGPLDKLAHQFGFETETAKRHRELRGRQETVLPLIHELMKAHATAPTAEEANVAFPGFPLTQEFYKQIPAHEEQLGIQQALLPNTFNIDELQNPAPTGITVDRPNLRRESPSQGMRTLPLEVPATEELLGQKRLTPALSAVFNQKLMQQRHQVPGEIQGISMEIEAQNAAFEEKNHRPPNKQEFADIVSRARGTDYKRSVAESRANYLNAKRELELPAKIQAMEALNQLRGAQQQLALARADFLGKLPDLKRELAGSPTFELDALKRVHTAIQKQQPIDKADWLIAERWLRKGSPRFSVDFMGRAFDRMSGQSERKGGPFGWTGLPEPPSTVFSLEDHAEAQEADQDLLSQFSSFIGSLLKGVVGNEPKPAPPTKLTPEEQAKLDQLRKKYGK